MAEKDVLSKLDSLEKNFDFLREFSLTTKENLQQDVMTLGEDLKRLYISLNIILGFLEEKELINEKEFTDYSNKYVKELEEALSKASNNTKTKTDSSLNKTKS